MLRQVKQNQIPFRYVLNDVRFTSADNIKFVKNDLERDFIMPLKTNRKVALRLEDKKQGRYERVDEPDIEADTVLMIYLEGVDFSLHLVKQVFTSGNRRKQKDRRSCRSTFSVVGNIGLEPMTFSTSKRCSSS